DCALCVYRLLGQQANITPRTCSVECEGSLDTLKLRLCQDVLLEEDVLALDNGKQEAAGAEHQLVKKYGGFMKRYGGFMTRRSPAATGGDSNAATEEGGARGDGKSQEQEEDIRLEILKILNAEAEGAGLRAGEESKRYGGFMRRGGGDLGLGEGLLEEGAGRGLKKRYGGFMRRVGRPEWLEDSKGSGGVLKRAWEEGGGGGPGGDPEEVRGIHGLGETRPLPPLPPTSHFLPLSSALTFPPLL
ncbi:proenkephalin-A-like, partial [Osmerus eperlanus]|uniref:proenkephalin-A-like n=1 Tax=Osmerus eperlanus TaxID=29151 RepID=UPI002E14E8D0